MKKKIDAYELKTIKAHLPRRKPTTSNAMMDLAEDIN